MSPHHPLMLPCHTLAFPAAGGITTRIFPGNALTPPSSNCLGRDYRTPDTALPARAGSLSCLSKFESFRFKSKLSSSTALRLQNKLFCDSYIRGGLVLPQSPSPSSLPMGKYLLPLDFARSCPFFKDPTPCSPHTKPQTQTSRFHMQ